MSRAVTITLTRYNEPDELVRRALAKACAQQGVAGEVLFIDQDLKGKISADQFAGGNLALRVIRRRLGGLSYARNLAIEEARNPLVFFLDADALARPDWAAALAAALNDETCAVAGSRIVPVWPERPPLWAKSTIVADQYSLLDLGAGTLLFPRVVGAGFGIDKAKLPADLRFDTELGRRDGKLYGGEESDFCRRARGLGLDIRYVGAACVEHVIQPDRMRLSWILRRMYYAGLGRAVAGGTPNPSRSPNYADWLCLPLILPPYALGWAVGRFG